MDMSRRSFLAGAAALATTAVAEAAPEVPKPERPPERCLLVSGQSLADYWRTDPAVIPAFKRHARGRWQVCVAAHGGTGITMHTRADRRWLEEDRSPGPIMRETIAKIRAWRGRRPTHVLWSQGQADGAGYKPGRERDQARFVEDFAERTALILETLRREIAGEDWREIPAYVQLIGWRRLGMEDGSGTYYQPPGYELVRFAQTRLIGEGGSRNIRLGPQQSPYADLRDGVHPSTRYYVNAITRQTARLVS